MSRPIRVLVADDSVTMRAALQGVLRAQPGIEVAGLAADGAEAVALARELRPDVITMDVRMPGLDGLQATAAIMASTPSRILLVCTVSEREQQELSFRAIEAGALEVVAKPGRAGGPPLERWASRLVETVRLMAEVPVVTRRHPATPVPPLSPSPARRAPAPPAGRPRPVRALGIAASTGGPAALARVFAGLPRDLGYPLLVAQHMASGFVAGLVTWLREHTGFDVRLARGGERPGPGQAWLPPDDHDLVVTAEGLLALELSRGGVCPSGDRLLASMAAAWGGAAAGLVLTGMGEDGARGLLAVSAAGGVTLAQDEATSVVFGMPAAAVRLGAAGRVLGLDAIAPALAELAAREKAQG